jgi:quercetin dioxygenase-like cupin family protein
MEDHMVRTFGAFAFAVTALALPTAVTAQNTGEAGVKTSIEAQFDHVIPNIPGKSVKTVLVTYAPGDSSGAHLHAKSAFIVAYVLEGEIVSGLNGQPARTYRAGEYWTESPGDHHDVSANCSKTKPAKLLAIFVVDSNVDR